MPCITRKAGESIRVGNSFVVVLYVAKDSVWAKLNGIPVKMTAGPTYKIDDLATCEVRRIQRGHARLCVKAPKDIEIIRSKGG